MAVRCPPRADTGDPQRVARRSPRARRPIGPGGLNRDVALAPAHLLREGEDRRRAAPAAPATLPPRAAPAPHARRRGIRRARSRPRSGGRRTRPASARSPPPPWSAPLGVEGRPLRGPVTRHHLGRLGVREPLHDHGQAARCRVARTVLEGEAAPPRGAARPLRSEPQDHGQLQGGSSSVPISNRRARLTARRSQERDSRGPPAAAGSLRQPGARWRGSGPIGRPLGDADGAPRVEQVERVRALETEVVSGQHELAARGDGAPPPRTSRRGRAWTAVSGASKLKRENSTSAWWKTSP